jgi:transcriptional regulator with XRE-family HTH domain
MAYFFWGEQTMNIELRVARIRGGLSQHELSLVTGISQSILSMFEQDYSKPNRTQAEAIANALGVKANSIFPETKE